MLSNWDPWACIPHSYNAGLDLSSAQVARGWGDVVAVHWENAAGARDTLTYRELDARSTALARSLRRMGVCPGDRVFLRLPNIPEFYVAAIAVLKNGGIFVPSSTQFRVSEVEYRLRDSGAAAAVVSTNLLAAVEEAAPRCPDLQHVIAVPYPDRQARTAGAEDFRRLASPSEDTRSPSWQPATTRHDDVAFIAYTSGTTGDAKGVAHFHRYPRAYAGQARFWHDYRDGDVVACPSELGWLLPLATSFLYALCRGLTVVLYDGMGGRFDAAKWFELFERYRITNFTATPTVYRLLAADAAVARRHDLTRWRSAVSCGEPLPADTVRAMKEWAHVAPLDGLGTSECPVYCCNMVDMPVKPGSCGKPGPGAVIDLMDDQLQPLPADGEGLLCVRRERHPGIMQGYWNKSQQTAQVFRGPWYVTGDVLRRDEDGYYWFQGRADDLIKTSGYLVSPFEIEECLCRHPQVQEAAVIGVADELRGQVIKGLVVLGADSSGNPALHAEIRDFCRAQIAPYKCPREIEFVDSLPKTVSGKIKRGALRADAAQ